MRISILLLVLVFGAFSSFGQVIPMSNTTVNSCSGTFTDSGNTTNPYGPNEQLKTTICPGSSSGNIRLSFSQLELRPGDELCFYDGIDANAPKIACSTNFQNQDFVVQAQNNSGCITSVFVSNAYQHGNGWQAAISCVPDCQPIVVEIEKTIPSFSSDIQICEGTSVTFFGTADFPQNNQGYHQDINQTTFEWDFGNGHTAVGQVVSHTFEKAGGYDVTLKATDNNGCRSTNAIETKVKVATPPVLSIAEELSSGVCSGQEINLYADATDDNASILIEQDASGFSYEKSVSDSLALPDGTGASYTSSVIYTEFPAGQTIETVTDVKKIKVIMEHSWLRDLEISIQCPNGQSAVLSHHPGNTGGEVFLGEPNEIDESLSTPIPGNGYEYSWTADAVNPDWITYVNQNYPTTLPPSDYQPYQSYGQLIGCPINGEWTFEVTDSWASDNGFVFSWSIDFDESLYPTGESFTPEITDILWSDNPAIIANNGANITAYTKHAGSNTFDVQVSNDYGCTTDTSITIHFLPETDPNCYDCSTKKTPLEDIAICPGQNINFDATFDAEPIQSLGFETFSNTLFSNSTSIKNTVTNVTPGLIGNVNYRVDSITLYFESTHPEGLEFTLISPSGKSLSLGKGIGEAGTHRICFTPNSTLPLASATAPYAGSFKPVGNWSTIQYEPTNGDWTLQVTDNQNPLAEHLIKSWSINFKNDISVGYHWTGQAMSCTDCPTPEITPTQSGEYIVEVYDNYGCGYQDTALVTIIPPLDAPEINEPEYENGQVIFSWQAVDFGDSYLIKIDNSNWIEPNGELSHHLDGYSLGDEINFKVKGVSQTGCEGNDSDYQLKITNCLLEATVNILTLPLCEGVDNGEIDVLISNATPPYQYRLNGGSYQAGSTFSNLSVGNHKVEVLDDAGCADTVYFVLNQSKSVALTLNETMISCFGAKDGSITADMTGGLAPINYQWDTNPVQNTASITSLGAGSYQVQAQDADGCQLTASTAITEPSEMILTSSVQDVTCYGLNNGQATIQVSGGSGNYSFAWDSGQSSATITDVNAGQYTVTVTDDSGCSKTEVIQINQPGSALIINANQLVVACAYTDDSKAQAIATGGVAPYTFLWSDGQENEVATNLAPGSITVKVTDDAGCQHWQTLEIEELEEVTATLDFTQPDCHDGTNGSVFVASITGGSSQDLADYSFQWLSHSTNSPTITDIEGDQSYYVTVTGNTGCKGTNSVLVTQPEEIAIEFDINHEQCVNEKNGSANIIDITGNVGPFDIQWDANAQSSQANLIEDLSPGQYWVTVTNPNGCTRSDYAHIKEAVPFDVEKLAYREPRCAGNMDGSITLIMEGGQTPYYYDWSTGDHHVSIGNLEDGEYTVTVTDANQCEHIENVVLEEPAPIISVAEVTDNSCYGENKGTIILNAEGGTAPLSFSLNNSSYTDNNEINHLTAGTYPIYVKDSMNCLYIDTITVTEPPQFSIDAGPNLEVLFGEPTEISIDAQNANGDISIDVINPSGESTSCTSCFEIMVEPRQIGNYQVIATDDNGCMAVDMFKMNVTKGQQFLVPTAFTPNGDGVNDYLTMHTRNDATVSMFRVYDRWGGLVYEASNIKSNDSYGGWDGYSRGTKLQAGVYVWTASVVFPTGEKEKFQGETNLLR